MPKIDLLQTGFNAGELSPLLYGATDSPRYKKGLQTCLNYIPTLQGPIIRRPATQYCAAAKVSTQPPYLIPFIFSQTQAYMLEFGQQYIRFYANNGQVVNSTTRYSVNGYKNWAYQFFGNRANINHGAYEEFLNSFSVAMGTPLNVQTPYNYSDLATLRFVQNADTLYLMHPNYPTYKLQRFGQDLWDLTQVLFVDGPYLPLNSYATIGDSTNVQLNIASVGASAAGVPGVGELTTGPVLTITGAITDPAGSGQIQITVSAAHGYTNGQLVGIYGIGGTVEAQCYDKLTAPSVTVASWPVLVNGATTFLLSGSTFVHAYTSGGTVYPALFSADIVEIIAGGMTPPNTTDNYQRNIAFEIGGSRYFGTLSGFIGANLQFPNAASAYIYLTGNGNSYLPSTGVATSWNLGVYCYGQGFPACGTFHQDRLCLAGATNNPQELDGSYTSQYENYAASNAGTLVVTDDNAISFQLNSTSINKIQWLSSNAQGLLAGTYVSEWAMTPSSASEALTPTNFNAQQTSYYGSANAESVQIGNAAIYIQRALRKVREMNFFFQVGTFRSTDLTELSEHITLPSITKLALQKETQPLIWGLISNGSLDSLIYDRNDVSLSAGWTRHQLGGQSDSSGTIPIVNSIAVIPSQDLSFDQLWMSVTRYINGSQVSYIEYMTKIFDDSILQEDACQGDCGGTYYVPQAITGISIASTCVVTVPGHGYSNGNQVKIVGVIGLGQSTANANGDLIYSNLVNEQTFTVAGATTNTFQLNLNGSPISSVGYGAWVSGGFVAKLITQISGVTWLEGETIGILADGAIHPPVTVTSGGVINLAFPAAKVQFGYPFNSQGMLMRAEGGAADGTSIGKTRRTTRVAVQIHRSGDLQLGTANQIAGPFTNMIPVEFTRQDQQNADTATPLFSGIVREGLESAYDFESQVCFQQNSMLPGCIQSITSFMEEQDI